MDLQTQIDELFKTHPGTDVFYMTSDNQFFFDKNHADAQAMRLKDRGVATVNRPEVQAEPVAAVTGDAAIAHPDASTVLSEQELAVKAADDEKATAALSTKLSPAPVEEAAPVVTEEAAPVVTEEAAPVVTEEAALVVTEEAAPVVTDEDPEIAADLDALNQAETKLATDKSKKNATENDNTAAV